MYVKTRFRLTGALVGMVVSGFLFSLLTVSAQVPAAPVDPVESPAARPRPKGATSQTYSPEQIQAGAGRFAENCGFCHGRDAAGGESGSDLTRSEIVAQDVRGDKLGPLLRAGRIDSGMPAFALDAVDLQSIVAYVHDQTTKFAALSGGRRIVSPADLATGNASKGKVYFAGAGGCAKCHSPTGDLAGIGTRYKGLTLLQRMLYPRGRPAPAQPTAKFTSPTGQTIQAPLTGEDEFSVTVLDPLGKPQTYARSTVKVVIENPLAAHFDKLAQYTDSTMHDVLAYLDTLK